MARASIITRAILSIIKKVPRPMRGLRKSPLLAGAVMIICALSLLLAFIQVSRYMTFGHIRHLAAQIEQGRPVSTASIQRALPEASRLLTDGICQTEFVRAALTIRLTDLDQQNQDADFDRWSTALQDAEDIARFALSCSPADGNSWVRLAMVRQTIGENPEEIAKLVTFSQLYAPAEENTLAARYRLYNRLSDATLALLEAPLHSDMRNLCSLEGRFLRERLPAPDRGVVVTAIAAFPGCELKTAVDQKSGR